jgi:hypothetical protein
MQLAMGSITISAVFHRIVSKVGTMLRIVDTCSRAACTSHDRADLGANDRTHRTSDHGPYRCTDTGAHFDTAERAHGTAQKLSNCRVRHRVNPLCWFADKIVRKSSTTTDCVESQALIANSKKDLGGQR